MDKNMISYEIGVLSSRLSTFSPVSSKNVFEDTDDCLSSLINAVGDFFDEEAFCDGFISEVGSELGELDEEEEIANSVLRSLIDYEYDK